MAVLAYAAQHHRLVHARPRDTSGWTRSKLFALETAGRREPGEEFRPRRRRERLGSEAEAAPRAELLPHVVQLSPRSPRRSVFLVLDSVRGSSRKPPRAVHQALKLGRLARAAEDGRPPCSDRLAHVVHIARALSQDAEFPACQRKSVRVRRRSTDLAITRRAISSGKAYAPPPGGWECTRKRLSPLPHLPIESLLCR